MKSVLVFAAIISIAQYSSAQAPPPADEAAKKGLQDFRQLASTSPSGKFGLESVEIEKTEIQKPLPIFLVKAEALANYAESKDPRLLLTDIHSFLYPISVAGAVKSSMQVDQSSGGEWRMVAVGRPNFIRGVSSSMDKAGPGAANDELRIVEIPALNMYFVARIRGKEIVLAPVGDNAVLNLKGGEQAPASEVFVKLRDKAKKALQNDVPR
jgi:hypothetical protein